MTPNELPRRSMPQVLLNKQLAEPLTFLRGLRRWCLGYNSLRTRNVALSEASPDRSATAIPAVKFGGETASRVEFGGAEPTPLEGVVLLRDAFTLRRQRTRCVACTYGCHKVAKRRHGGGREDGGAGEGGRWVESGGREGNGVEAGGDKGRGGEGVGNAGETRGPGGNLCGTHGKPGELGGTQHHRRVPPSSSEFP